MWSGSRARAVAITGSALALAAALGLMEAAYLPPLPVPGVKLGLANLAVLVVLAISGPRAALAVTAGRVTLVGVLSGTLAGPAGVLAVAGALAAWAVMSALSRTGDAFSLVGWSAAGAVAHVVAQLGAVCALTGSVWPLAFAPTSVPLAAVLGAALGALARVVVSRLTYAGSPADARTGSTAPHGAPAGR